MATNAFEELRALVNEALELDPAERESFLEELGRKNPSRANEVRRLLRHESNPDGILRTAGAQQALTFDSGSEATDSPGRTGPTAARHSNDDPTTASHADDSAASLLGQQIGPYRLERVLGEGGMGCVYLAVQEEPVQREVALKLIRDGLGGPNVLRRFRNEQHILANLHHPHIARMFDAGQTDDGAPYFVMEYVPGVAIDKHCRDRKLSLPETLKLFVQVCRAIQHAHQRGVLHRDIKAENILVVSESGIPQPKIIDFGIAKALVESESEQSMLTRAGQFVGTPEYASPEQAGAVAAAADTGSDVYSLGVVLHLLLTGEFPFDPKQMRSAGTFEALRILREDEPPAASTRITDRKLKSVVRGELDWIIRRTLHKDRDERYATAHDLARDIERYLAGEPVEAGPATTTYRLRRLAGRHRAAFIGATATLLTLIAAVVISSTLFVRAERARTRSVVEAQKSERVTEFLTGMLQSVSPLQQGREVTVRELLDEVATHTANDLEEEPEVQATLHATVAGSYLSLGLTDPALEQAKEALDLQTELNAPDDPEVVHALQELARVYQFRGELAVADSILRVAEQSDRNAPEERAASLGVTLHRRADIANRQGQEARSEPLYAEALAIAEQAPEERTEILLVALDGLATLALSRSAEESLSLRERAYAQACRLYSPKHYRARRFHRKLARVLQRLGRLDEAERIYRDLIQLERSPEIDDGVGWSYNLFQLASLLCQTGRCEEGEQCLQESLEERLRIYGPEHYTIATTKRYMAIYREQAGDIAAAQRLFEDALAVREKVLPDHVTYIGALNGLGDFHLRQHEPAQALPYFEKGLEAGTRILGPDHVDQAYSYVGVAEANLALGNREAAVAAARKAVDLRDAHLPPDDTTRTEARELFDRALRLGTPN